MCTDVHFGTANLFFNIFDVCGYPYPRLSLESVCFEVFYIINTFVNDSKLDVHCGDGNCVTIGKLCQIFKPPSSKQVVSIINVCLTVGLLPWCNLQSLSFRLSHGATTTCNLICIVLGAISCERKTFLKRKKDYCQMSGMLCSLGIGHHKIKIKNKQQIARAIVHFATQETWVCPSKCKPKICLQFVCTVLLESCWRKLKKKGLRNEESRSFLLLLFCSCSKVVNEWHGKCYQMFWVWNLRKTVR